MVEEDLIKDKIVDTELSNFERIEEFERIDLNEENSLMATNETRSINDNGRVCHVIGSNLFNTDLIQTYGIVTKLDTGFRLIKGSGRLGPEWFVNLPKGLYTFVSSYSSTGLINSNDVSVRVRYDDDTYNYVGSDRSSFTFGNENKKIKSLMFYFQLDVNNGATVQYDDVMIIKYNELISEYEPYEGCLYGLELYDTIEPNFITDNYFINCGIISIFLFLIILIVNSPFIFIRKVKGN